MLRIKVCGMKDPANIRAIADLSPEYMGLIFYPKSPRNCQRLDPRVLKALGSETRLVGIFVNETPYNIRKTAARFGFTTLQLHGNESPAACDALEQDGFTVIKAFPIATLNDMEAIAAYQDVCSYILLDTRITPNHCDNQIIPGILAGNTSGNIPEKHSESGGTGRSFDWNLLQHYPSQLPFFLSGGISPESIPALRSIVHPLLYAVDINSRFETSPGIKDPALIHSFMKTLQS